MTATYESDSIHPGGEGVFVSSFLILFALIGVIRGQLLELGLLTGSMYVTNDPPLHLTGEGFGISILPSVGILLICG